MCEAIKVFTVLHVAGKFSYMDGSRTGLTCLLCKIILAYSTCLGSSEPVVC